MPVYTRRYELLGDVEFMQRALVRGLAACEVVC